VQARHVAGAVNLSEIVFQIGRVGPFRLYPGVIAASGGPDEVCDSLAVGVAQCPLRDFMTGDTDNSQHCCHDQQI